MSHPKSCILLVDDAPSNLLLLEHLLQDRGYNTTTASSGTEALETLETLVPDLILLDVMMPDIDGFQVCQRLRQQPTLQAVPVIFLTALDDDSSRLKALEMLGDDYLTKPVNIDLLLAKIESTLRLRQMRQEAAQKASKKQLQEQLKRQMEVAWSINQTLVEKFHLFVPEQLLERIAPQGVESIELGNSREDDVTILFCDIRGFSSLAESQLPGQTLKWLNALFNDLSQAVAAHHGFVDKFMGDAILSVFDRPQTNAEDALNAALLMNQKLQVFNGDRDTFGLAEPLRLGFGIHSGHCIIGTVGSANRMQPTVIGDAVNTAARLEELTKVYDCEIIASSSCIDALPDRDVFYHRWIDRVVPRGKQQSQDIYEVLGKRDRILDAGKLDNQDSFAKAIAAWKREDIDTALEFFQKSKDIYPGDQVAALYVERCQEKLRSRPCELT